MRWLLSWVIIIAFTFIGCGSSSSSSSSSSSVTALSLPEAMILKRILHVKLIGVFFGIVGLGIIGIGYLFNAIL